jgi:Pyruvate/2-oxoglutarate dehydrogenase complex, dihydrolipoamide acyltransferase (E2) component, and related enzymes
MILEMKVPSPGESISEVEIAEWLVKDGDFVEKDQTIAEVDSDKATLDLPAEESGVITLKAEEGDAVAVGQVVCLIDTDAKAPKAKKEKEQEKPITIIKLVEDSPVPKLENSFANGTPSPAASKILSEKNISSSSVSGSGRGGRITKDDALKALPKVD